MRSVGIVTHASSHQFSKTRLSGPVSGLPRVSDYTYPVPTICIHYFRFHVFEVTETVRSSAYWAESMQTLRGSVLAVSFRLSGTSTFIKLN